MENSSAKRAPKAQRRSHAERSAETRAKIIDAVVDSISDVGFQATTATEISNRAGVTWGAVQHHFGGKDGILEAVLEDTLSRFAARLADIPKSGPLEERVSLFINRCWEHYRSPHYRSTFEILLNLMPKAVAAGGTSRHLQALDQLDELWTQIFADVELPRAERLGLESYTVAVLSGLASHLMLLGKQPAPFRREVELLKTAVLRGLRGKSD